MYIPFPTPTPTNTEIYLWDSQLWGHLSLLLSYPECLDCLVNRQEATEARMSEEYSSDNGESSTQSKSSGLLYPYWVGKSTEGWKPRTSVACLIFQSYLWLQNPNVCASGRVRRAKPSNQLGRNNKSLIKTLLKKWLLIVGSGHVGKQRWKEAVMLRGRWDG